jgi:hypothetical protein
LSFIGRNSCRQCEEIVDAEHYLLTSTIEIATTNISLVGENQDCVRFEYKGTGTAILFQIKPFSISPAGELRNFTLHGTPAGQIGIKTGSTIGAKFEQIRVSGFTNGTAFELDDDREIAPPKGPWTERNTWLQVSEEYNKIGWHLQSPGQPENNSFGYNEFISIYMNVSKDQVGFWLDTNTFLYHGYFRATCNEDDHLPGSLGPICMRISGAVTQESIFLGGEYQQIDKQSPPAYSVQIDKTGAFTGWGEVAVSEASVNNLRGSSFDAVARLNSMPQSWDTGSLKLGQSDSSPQIGFGGRSGTVGVLFGKNVESPFVTMYRFAGNKFVVGAVPYGSPIAAMTPLWSVDERGNVSVSSNENVKGLLNMEGGMRIATRGKRPECTPSTRGQIWESFGASEHDDDHLDVCQRRNGRYEWVSQ